MRNLDIRVMVSESGLKYIDIAKQMGISRVWLSNLMRYDLTPENRNKILKAIRELKEAGAGMDKFFSGASESSTETTKKPAKRNTKTEPEKVTESPQKTQKKVFSFRAEVDQKKIYELKMAQKKS